MPKEPGVFKTENIWFGDVRGHVEENWGVVRCGFSLGRKGGDGKRGSLS